MSKENFITLFKQIDENYIPKGYKVLRIPYFEEKLKEKNYQSIKDCCIKENMTSYLSNVNIQKINTLCTYKLPTYNKKSEGEIINPFQVFYELDDDVIKSLFHILAKTHKAINYYGKYSENTKELQSKNTHGNISRKIVDVRNYIIDTDSEIAEIIEKMPQGEKLPEYNTRPDGQIAIEYLSGLLQKLNNKHYTLRQVFQDLLYEIHTLLEKENISKSKIINTVNSLIKNYFDEDIEFTSSTKIKDFTTINYLYDTMAGIDLTHGKK